MGLLGALSNPGVQDRLRQLSDKLDRLSASGAAPRPSARRDQKLRCGLVPNAIEHVLADSSKPTRVREVHAEVEELLGMSVPVSSVKNWLAREVSGSVARVVRLSRGRYQAIS